MLCFIFRPFLLGQPAEVPEFRLNDLRSHAITQLLEVVNTGNMNFKEASGEKQEYLFV